MSLVKRLFLANLHILLPLEVYISSYLNLDLKESLFLKQFFDICEKNFFVTKIGKETIEIDRTHDHLLMLLIRTFVIR